jgi:predicted DCC family thiol-disulfide oxidoreductase YuxK
MRRLDRDHNISFIDTTSQSCPLDREDMLARFHAQEAGGPLLSGAAAFAAMWRAVPLLRPLGLLARNRRALGIMEALYVRFLYLRPRLQRLAAQIGA